MNESKVRLSTKEQVLFFKQFGILLQGGIPLLDSLQTMLHHAKRKKIQLVIRGIIKESEQGRQLFQALRLFPKTFDNSAVNAIEVGEMSGTLSDSLVSAAQELQQNLTAKKKIIGSLIYPAIVIAATIGVVALLVLYVFPKVLPVFASVHMKLPFTTRVLIMSNTAVRNHGWYLAGSAMILGLILSVGATNKRLRKFRDSLFLKTPLIGPIVKNYILANVCRTLGQLLQKNVPLLKAVIITANSTKHSLYKQRLIALSMAVNRGQSIAQFMERESSFFPPLLYQLVSVGEKTSTLSDNFIFLGRLYEQEINDLMANISVILEPLMMVVIGSLVGFVAISIITPIYQITQNIHG
jgi:type II secretory pathway component PulF